MRKFWMWALRFMIPICWLLLIFISIFAVRSYFVEDWLTWGIETVGADSEHLKTRIGEVYSIRGMIVFRSNPVNEMQMEEPATARVRLSWSTQPEINPFYLRDKPLFAFLGFRYLEPSMGIFSPLNGQAFHTIFVIPYYAPLLMSACIPAYTFMNWRRARKKRLAHGFPVMKSNDKEHGEDGY